MPAKSTSAEKKRQAQQARRKAAQKSAANRRARKKPVAASAATSTATTRSSAVEPVPAVVTPVENLASSQPTAETAEAAAVSDMPSTQPEATATGDDNATLETLCEIADTNPSALGPDLGSVRQLCRNRRKALSTRGKAAVPGKRRVSGRSGGAARRMAYAAGQINGRDLAKLRRQEISHEGRGDVPASRPSGRVKPMTAPPKVEVGTTLSGQEVSGTQVERATMVTGNESGTCRSITGTEYIGSEQFATFCGAQPEPNPPKVGVSITGTGKPVTGTEVGRSEKVTGDEHGSCVNVTGSEYVGADKMANFCGVTPSPRPAKVMSGRTEGKHISITGSDEARANATTGNEPGAGHQITGSQYADAGSAKMTINGPSKVALTHTIAGQPVTGTEVGRSARVTGDEYGSCRPVTGTEYISNEQFATVCGTITEPHPAKVGVDSSQQGQRITGALVDRSEKVTGNEPGSCTRLTGTQYGESKICGGAAPKVRDMHTISGNNLTGNSVDLSPKMTGDEQGGCLPVTGIEYYGQEQFAQCPNTPVARPAKVEVDHTPAGQHVSGTMVGATGNVTGNEHGAALPVSGTPYAGIQVPANHGACCDACAARDLAEAAGLIAPAQEAHAPAPQQPAAPQYPVQQAVPTPAPSAPQEFSIVSPARMAQITGSRYGGSRVTGPGDMATNRVSGTPEFRYPDLRHIAAPQPAPVMAAPQADTADAAIPEQGAQPVVMHQQRITGEGREDGVAVTGDNWGRGPGMTGTEGYVAQARNPSLRSNQPALASGAHANRALERPEVAAAMVTGSSGASEQGAVVTVSGGARG